MADYHRIVDARLRATNKIDALFRRKDPVLYLSLHVGLHGILEQVFLTATRSPCPPRPSSYSEDFIHWSGPKLDEFVFVCDMLLEDVKEDHN